MILVIDSLFSQINLLSEQIETLLLEENEEQCPDLLAKRLSLLQALATVVEKSSNQPDSEMIQQGYQEFLLSIQARDQVAMASIEAQKQQILSKNNQQVKTKKALNAYQKFGY